MIVETAIQEDVDAVGVSILSGAHMTVFPRILTLMKEKGVNDVLVFGGGIIPEKDIEELKRLGAGQLFTPGAPTHAIVDYIKTWVEKNRT
jgi:methylmalonyl-CoA mutase C-terminal domain/subunit